MVTIKCKRHPNYMAIRQPAPTCETCVAMYSAIQLLEQTPYFYAEWPMLVREGKSLRQKV